MNVKLKFVKIWISFVIIFISFVNGTHLLGNNNHHLVVKVEEDPLVDKITKVNHNLKLVKLKKVKKVYSNIPDELEPNELTDNHHLTRKPTIVDLNAKYNVVTQTPIPFLLIDKPVKNNNQEFQNELKLNNNKLIEELNNKNDQKFKPKLDNEVSKLNDELNKSKLNKINDEIKQKSIKKLFPSVNKFKQLNLSKPISSTFNRPTSLNPFASSSNKSTLKTEFINKVSTKKPTTTTTTIRPTINQNKKFMKANSKIDKYKLLFTTTTTEQPRTYAYKPTKRTTTFKPYIYSVTTQSTIEPILRIRKSKATSIATTTNRPYLDDNKITHKENKKTDQNLILNENKPDLESHSSRKYAKLSLNKKSKEETTTPSFLKYTTATQPTRSYTTTTTPSSIIIPSTRSYLRTNSRVSTFTSYLPFTTDYTTTTPELSRTFTYIPEYRQKNVETTTESLKNNVINRSKILTASRKKPIYKPRTVRPAQLAQLTTTSSPKLETTTLEPISTTTYSPSFRSTTTYSPKFRSTTQTSSDNYLNQFRTTTPLPITNVYREFKLTKDLGKIDYTSTDLPIINNESPSDLDSRNELINNLIPRRSKWILKEGTRQKKSESSSTHIYDHTNQPLATRSYEETTIRPIITTISSLELRNRLKEKEDELNRNNDSENELPEYKTTIDRSPKSIDKFYQMRRPQPFLITKQKEEDNELFKLKYEEPNRKYVNVNSNELDPNKEIYYKDIKIKKESKLVPQTYLYPTIQPSLNELNERLNYLNEEKSKYQRPIVNERPKNYEIKEKEEEEVPKERYSKLPSNQPYYPPSKYQNNYENKPNPTTSNPNPIPTDNQSPYIKSHFNLGYYSNNSPKYGSIFKQVGKLSKPFSNQAPLPYFESQSNNDKLTYYNNQPELFRYPNKAKELEEEKRTRVVDLKPFDFKNYHPLPNTKFIRTDLESEKPDNKLSERYPNDIEHEKEYKRPIIDTSYEKPKEFFGKPKEFNKPITENPIYERPIEYPRYSKPITNSPFDRPYERPIEYPKYKRPIVNENTQYEKLIDDYSRYRKPIDAPYEKPIIHTQAPRINQAVNYNTHHNNRLPPLDFSNENRNVRFNFNRIPAKVVYDKYNQKFIGSVNLKSPKYLPTSRHYADIPKNILPIEYQRNPIPVNRPIINNKPIIDNPIYRNPIENSRFNTKPIEYPKYNRPVYNDFNSYESNKPIYNEFNRYKPATNNQNNLRFIYPNRPKEEEVKPLRNNNYNSPVHYNQPIYYNQFINHDQINNQQFNQHKPQYNQFNNQEKNNHLINPNNQFNAGHYDNNNYNSNNNNNRIELINLNDIRPNLSLFNNKLPDFKLLQNTVISHDVPVDRNYNLKKK